MKRILAVVFGLVIPITLYPQAFPGAEGFGTETIGGRGGRIIFVTNLKSSGPGSFRAAWEAEGPRIIIPLVSGTVEDHREILVQNPFATYAGQAAPGDGLLYVGMITILDTHDIIIRGLPVNNWDSRDGARASGRSPIEIGGSWNIVIDHCRLAFGIDETAANGQGAHDVTWSWNRIVYGLKCSLHKKGCHSKGLMFHNTAAGNFTGHHNLLAHSDDRNPQMVCPGKIEWYGNTVYNYGWGARIANDAQVNVIKNNYIAGPNTRRRRKPVIWDPRIATPGTKMYLYGNIGPGRERDEGDEALISEAPANHESREPLFASHVTDKRSAQEISEDVLAHSGPIHPDELDLKVLSDIEHRRGKWIDTIAEIGGQPHYAEGADPARDTDKDGMPDEWESRRGLDPEHYSADEDANRNGYPDVEDYLNGLISRAMGEAEPFPESME